MASTSEDSGSEQENESLIILSPTIEDRSVQDLNSENENHSVNEVLSENEEGNITPPNIKMHLREVRNNPLKFPELFVTTVKPITPQPKPRTKATHPPASKMVIIALKDLHDRKGTSIQSINKYIMTNFIKDFQRQSIYIKKFLKKSVENGTIIQMSGKGLSGSFKLASMKKKVLPRRKILKVKTITRKKAPESEQDSAAVKGKKVVKIKVAENQPKVKPKSKKKVENNKLKTTTSTKKKASKTVDLPKVKLRSRKNEKKNKLETAIKTRNNEVSENINQTKRRKPPKRQRLKLKKVESNGLIMEKKKAPNAKSKTTAAKPTARKNMKENAVNEEHVKTKAVKSVKATRAKVVKEK